MGNRIFMGLALTLALPACVSLGAGKAPPQLIGLTAASSAPLAATASGKRGDAIVVLEPETDRSLAVQRVPVQVSDSAVAYLKDAQWVDRPARLFRSLLAETIRARAGNRLVLEASATEPGGAVRLSGRLIAMGYDVRSQSAVVRFDAMIEKADGTVTVRRFEAAVSGVAPKAATVGPALNAAANQVAADVAEWVGKA